MLRHGSEGSDTAVMEMPYADAGMGSTMDGGAGESEQIMARAISSGDRVEDAKALAELGFGPSILGALTGWPERFSRAICDRAGRKNRGGKARSDLAETVKIPMCHTAISVFVMAVEHQMEYWGDTRLTARVLIRAIRYVQSVMPDAMQLVPMTGLYTIAQETVKKTVKTAVCKHCRGSYAQISLQSGLTGMTVYDCPSCRMFNLMLRSRKHSVENCIPTSFADLKLREPILRYSSKGAGRDVVHAISALAQGPVSRRVN